MGGERRRPEAFRRCGTAGIQRSGNVYSAEAYGGFPEENPDARFYLEVSDSKTVWNNMQENKGELGFTGDFRGNSLGCENLCRDESC